MGKLLWARSRYLKATLEGRRHSINEEDGGSEDIDAADQLLFVVSEQEMSQTMKSV